MAKRESPTADTRSFFDSRANEYYRRNYLEPRSRHAHNLALRRAACLELVPDGGDRVLDLGCGPGAMTLPLAQQGRRVVAFDLSFEMVREASRLAASFGADSVRCCTGHASRLPFATHSFDVVVSTGVLEYVADLDSVLAEANRVLRPGGTLVATMSLPRALERRAATWYLAARRALGESADQPWQRPMSHGEFDRAVLSAGFVIDARRTVTFAPFPLDALAPALVPLIDRWMGPVLEKVAAARSLAKTYAVAASTSIA